MRPRRASPVVCPCSPPPSSPAVCSSDQVHWTNNASGARTVTLHISDIRLVEVRAHLRYRIG
ncbi:hypothetical protein ACWGSU_30405 [Streptomyces koyangensis]